jgi:hypothetical protein
MRKAKMGGGMMMKRPGMKKGSIPPQLKKFVMAKKKKAIMKKAKAKIKKVMKGLQKASKTHAAQAKTLKGVIGGRSKKRNG